MFCIEITEVTQKPNETQKWVMLSDGGSYGYVDPPKGEMVRVQRVVLKQEIETINLPEVIRAVNGL